MKVMNGLLHSLRSLRFAQSEETKAVQPNPLRPWAQDTPGMDRFVVIGDAGSGNEDQYDIANQMIKAYKKTPFASVIVLGDNVYEEGDPTLFEERIYQPYKKLFEAGVRFFPVLGNHDVQNGYGDDQLKYWGVPHYYRFTQGPVEFFALDTTVLLPGYDKCYVNDQAWAKQMGDAELKWLDQSLNASHAPFKIVYGHYPLYSSGRNGKIDQELTDLRQRLEPILGNRISAYLAGHVHRYERSQLIKGFIHFISGAGSKLHEPGIPAPYPRAKDIDENQFMLFESQDNQLKFKVISKQGNVLDSGTISKPQLSQIA